MARSRRSPKKNPVPRLSWTARELCASVGISIATYKRLKAAGRGPKELRLSPKVIRIAPAEAEKWLRTLAAANRSDPDAA
ncbi:hypothetical protein [Bradyrhizobium sp. Mp27]|uniref:hypothetical protein n=1 Tax=Bradyrhizobium sp. Mp27 TaxID=3042157 RepID=UPI00248AC1E8|nr:hypothetical protein [Bradyrhizobium sp. Mp27]MDI2076552.1 hypothetical protein [Bradyrhizobium sp. Mp27]